jgi:hypothetical protein
MFVSMGRVYFALSQPVSLNIWKRFKAEYQKDFDGWGPCATVLDGPQGPRFMAKKGLLNK